ncbi:serpin-ZX [Tanacetum coccineum]
MSEGSSNIELKDLVSVRSSTGYDHETSKEWTHKDLTFYSMAEGRIKRTVSGDELHILSEKKKKLTPTATVSANSTTIVTKTLLDDAHNGFKNGNFVCSPLSLEIILGMLAAGAEGKTLKQLLDFLGHESIDELLTESPTQILSGGADDLVVFVNALYFKGAWSKPFIPLLTNNRDFHLINGEKVSVPFMTQKRPLAYGCFKDYKMIELPYKSDGQLKNFSMYIFLPHGKDGLQSLLEHFHSDDALFRGDFDLKPTTFDELRIPKFKISCTFKPQDVMQLMGLTLPFKSTNKELSGIVG